MTPIRVVRAVPVASFIILALVWIKTEALPSFISAAMAAPMVWQSVSTALSEVDVSLLEMARVYKVPPRRALFGIVLPAVYPAFMSGAQNALGFAWKSGVAAEVICQPALSIGKQLQNAKIYLETPDVFAWTITVCALSMGLERLPLISAGGRRAHEFSLCCQRRNLIFMAGKSVGLAGGPRGRARLPPAASGPGSHTSGSSAGSKSRQRAKP
ncbi:MAG: ABC transporter permease [Eubacteriales bacterium]